ncbi:hypothetical protein QYE76_020600 [Lolium multiflorum]|uniref:CCHC-type domain-containing protein n=1 Tax=Lolium multiflorum TaxID=4521 RepID=A0AAD8R547_LOLMU|nr:hypothetical protein QYE76_020600 [Lolium multiflorum]
MLVVEGSSPRVSKRRRYGERPWWYRTRAGRAVGSCAGGNSNNNNPPPAWWVERERKREVARLAQEVASSLAPAPTPAAASDGGRAAEAAADKMPVEQGRASGQRAVIGVMDAAAASSNMECFKCGRMGHFQATCTPTPVCLLCVAGESFFTLEFKEDEEEVEGMYNGAVISFKHVVLSAQDLNRELHHLVEADWDWKVEEMVAHEFSVVFPSRESLQISARSGWLFLPLSWTVADIRLTDSDPAPVEMLQEVWVRFTGVPRRMRRVDRLLTGLRMLGWPVRVEEESICHRQPVRMLIECCSPYKLKSIVQLFDDPQV